MRERERERENSVDDMRAVGSDSRGGSAVMALGLGADGSQSRRNSLYHTNKYRYITTYILHWCIAFGGGGVTRRL